MPRPTLADLLAMHPVDRIRTIVELSNEDLIEFTMENARDVQPPWSSILACFCARLAMSTGARGSRRMCDGLSAAVERASVALDTVDAAYRVPMDDGAKTVRRDAEDARCL